MYKFFNFLTLICFYTNIPITIDQKTQFQDWSGTSCINLDCSPSMKISRGFSLSSEIVGTQRNEGSGTESIDLPAGP